MEANQVSIFIAEETSNTGCDARPQGCMPVAEGKFIEKTVAVGEGLVGRAYQKGM